VCAAAAIPIVHSGLWVMARRAESVAVLEAFLATDMADGCHLLSATEARRRCPQLNTPLLAVLESDAELRVESRTAIPRLAAWLTATHGVTFMRNTNVCGVDTPRIHTTRGVVLASRAAVCPGDDFTNLYPERLGAAALTRCKLQMLRLAAPGFRVPAALMSDLSLIRYPGFAQLAAAAPLARRIAAEQPRHLSHGIHLIVVQSADGTLVVGDSHEYASAPDPFGHEDVDALILDEFRAALGREPPGTVERWIGTYASASDRPVLIDAPEPEVRIVVVTSGVGATIGFALGEEVITSLFGSGPAG
jgi:FAD dependent oxidoreductase TIGR03364